MIRKLLQALISSVLKDIDKHSTLALVGSATTKILSMFIHTLTDSGYPATLVSTISQLVCPLPSEARPAA